MITYVLMYWNTYTPIVQLYVNHNMVLIIPGRLERVNARQGSQDATSKIRWSGFCSIEFLVDKVLIVGRCRRFVPSSLGRLMETWEDDKVHNNLALTSAIMYTEGWLVIIQVRKFALYHRLQSCQITVQGRLQSLLCIVHSIGSNSFGWGHQSQFEHNDVHAYVV